MNKNINKRCRYYDYGDTAPREYGAFCRREKKAIESVNCDECDEKHSGKVDIEIYKGICESLKIQDVDKDDAEMLQKILRKYFIYSVRIIGV